jgi:hypothetical protein
MGLIKPSGHGVIESTGYVYKASLKIKTQNVIQVEDEEVGLQDKEELIEFKIPCETNAEAAELGVMFRALKNNGVVVSFDGELPRFSKTSEYLGVTVFSFDILPQLEIKLKELKNITGNYEYLLLN